MQDSSLMEGSRQLALSKTSFSRPAPQGQKSYRSYLMGTFPREISSPMSRYSGRKLATTVRADSRFGTLAPLNLPGHWYRIRLMQYSTRRQAIRASLTIPKVQFGYSRER